MAEENVAAAVEEKTLPADPPPVEEKKEATPAEIRKWKLKDGEEEEEVLEEDLVRYAQMGRHAQKQMAENARVKKDLAEVFQYMTKDKRKALEQIFLKESGGDRTAARKAMNEFAERIVADRIEEESLTPEEKSSREKAAELKKQEDDLRRQKAEWEQKLLEVQKAELKAKYDKEIPAALEKVGLAGNKKAEARVWQYIEWAAKNNFDLPPDIAAKEVKKERLAARKDLLSEMTAQDIKDQHPDLYKAIVKSYTEEIRGASTPKPPTRKDGTAGPQDQGRSGRKTYSTFRELHESLSQRDGSSVA